MMISISWDFSDENRVNFFLLHSIPSLVWIYMMALFCWNYQENDSRGKKATNEKQIWFIDVTKLFEVAFLFQKNYNTNTIEKTAFQTIKDLPLFTSVEKLCL